MTMDATKAPGVRIDAIALEGLSYRKSGATLGGTRYNININLNNEIQLKGDEVQPKDPDSGRLVSKLKVTEAGQGLFELEVVYCLYASVIADQANMPLVDFLRNHAPAILYQFSRETLLTITQKAGIPTILPPLNLSGQPTPEATQG